MLPLRVAYFNNEKSFAVTCGLSGVVQTYDFENNKLEAIKIPMPVASKSGYFWNTTIPSPACIVVGKDDQSAHVSLYRAGLVAHIDLKNKKVKELAETAFSPDGIALVSKKRA
jgi:hypothetical protein